MGKKHHIHHQNDKTLRAVLQSKKAFMQLLRYMLDEEWAHRINEQTLTRMDKSFVLNDFSSQEADIVYRCQIDGQDAIFYILLEMQSSVDHQMPWRLLQYMVEIWRSTLKEEKPQRRRTTFRLPAIIPVVLYVGSATWSARQSFREYQHNGALFGKHVIDFQYHLVDVRRFSKEKLAQQEGILPFVLRLEQITEGRTLLDLLQHSMDTIGKLDEEEVGLVYEYMKRVLFLLTEGQPSEDIEKTLNLVKGGSDMVSNVVKVLRKEMKNQKKEGLQAGRMEGLQEGLMKGLKEGHLEAQCSMVKRMVARGMTIEEIAECTGYTSDELASLINGESSSALS